MPLQPSGTDLTWMWVSEANREPARLLQSAGTGEAARWPVLTRPDVSPHGPEDSHPFRPQPAGKPLEGRRSQCWPSAVPESGGR